MTKEELQTLFDKVIQQTDRKLLKWKPVKDDSLRVDFARSSVEIYREAANVDRLLIYNSSGAVVAAINSTFSEGAQQKLAALYDKAYDIAFQVDDTLQDVLASLEGDAASATRFITGIYGITFTALNSGTSNQAVVVVGPGVINGGDAGYLYKGTYRIENSSVTITLAVTRWSQNINTIFGNVMPNFQLVLQGQLTEQGAIITVEGNVPQQPHLRLRVVGRRLAELQRPD
jgi:hypothetical protein